MEGGPRHQKGEKMAELEELATSQGRIKKIRKAPPGM